MDWRSLVTQLFDRCLHVWGTSIIYKSRIGKEQQLQGIVDFNPILIDPDSAVSIQSDHIHVRIRAGDLKPLPLSEDEIIIANQTYTIIETQADGQGTILLVLHRDSTP